MKSSTCRKRQLSAVWALVVVMGCGLALLGCEVPSSGPTLGTKPLVKIGLAASFEGLGRPLGYEALAGTKLALAERNASGGVGGYMVELVALNDYGEPDEARLQAREFAADPAVLGVVTGWTEPTATAALPVYRAGGLGVVVPWGVPSSLADGQAGIMLAAADADQMARVLAEQVAAVEPKWVVLVADGPAANLYGKALRSSGLQVEVVPPPDRLGARSVRDWASRLLMGGAVSPDALVLAADGVLAAEILSTLAMLGWRGPVFGGAEVGSPHLVSVAGDKAAGLVFASPSPAGGDVRGLSEANGGSDLADLGPRAVLAYDATYVLLDAIELAIRRDGYPSRMGVLAALPAVDRQGLTGPIGFDAAGHRLIAPVWLYQVDSQGYPGHVVASIQAGSGQ